MVLISVLSALWVFSGSHDVCEVLLSQLTWSRVSGKTVAGERADSNPTFSSSMSRNLKHCMLDVRRQPSKFSGAYKRKVECLQN